VALPSRKKLRKVISATLRRQGYCVKDGVIQIPEELDKDRVRTMHELAVAKKRAISGPGVKPHEERLIRYIANGADIVPEAICPEIVLVKRDSEDELLFRYACLHWSIPVSSGYGRRLRFLVKDQSNGKLIGLLGLGDPVYSVNARDTHIGWNNKEKKRRLWHVLDAFALGAVPPYSFLLGGKLVAMLALSNEVRRAFRRKYGGTRSLIKRIKRPPYLALLTTTSALGRSSIFNRIRINGVDYWTSVGFTRGSGEFHFSNGVYDQMRAFVDKKCEPTAKADRWGSGFRNKREVIRKCLSAIGMSQDLTYHGIRREVFVAPLGCQALRFLRGAACKPGLYDWPAAELALLFKDRWLLERAARVPEYRQFRRDEYRLWSDGGK
jgi:hypothetical protein